MPSSDEQARKADMVSRGSTSMGSASSPQRIVVRCYWGIFLLLIPILARSCVARQEVKPSASSVYQSINSGCLASNDIALVWASRLKLLDYLRMETQFVSNLNSIHCIGQMNISRINKLHLTTTSKHKKDENTIDFENDHINRTFSEMSLKSSEKVLIGKMRGINFSFQKNGKEAEEETEC